MAGQKELEREELNTRISVSIYVLVGIAAGFVSLLISPIVGNMLAIFLGLVLAWLIGRIVQIVLGKKDMKWLIGNGLFIYLFVWVIAWIFFFNLLGA